jgi:hypothetical protein
MQFKNPSTLVLRDIDYGDNFPIQDADTSKYASIPRQRETVVNKPRYHIVPVIVGWSLITVSVLFTFTIVIIILCQSIVTIMK